MATVFFPSCKYLALYPEASAELRAYLFERGHIDTSAGCCKKIPLAGEGSIAPEDTAVVLCNSCYLIVEESLEPQETIHVFDLILNDGDFSFPDYQGEKITLQDCWRAKGRHRLHDTVRELLKKMNFEVVELKERGSFSSFCGISLLLALPAEVRERAPKFFGSLEEGIFEEHTPEEQEKLMKEHVKQIDTTRVVSYCPACDVGLKLGAGPKSVSLLDLLFCVCPTPSLAASAIDSR